MKTQHPILRKVPHAALAAIMSLSLVLKPAYAADPTGIFVQTGSNLNLSNLTYQN
jgi:hypothetical protein